jgi:predicted metalloprotease
MEWEDRPESENVEDQRGYGRRTGIAIGGGAGLLILLVSLFLGVDPRRLANVLGPGPAPPEEQGAPVNPEEDRLAHFTKVIFHDTEVVWDEQFRRLGRHYEKPTLVLFTAEVDSACGTADAAVGPFYCPMDSKVYIDLSFYRDMERKLRAPGDFARAYVVAHEVGHHVQRLLGFPKRGDTARRAAHESSVRTELQADYLAGVWAYHGQRKFQFLDPGDIDSALNAAYQIGDDRLQMRSRGYVVPDSFTHGTSKQRDRWFLKGFRTGSVEGARELFELPYDEL